MLRPTNSNAWKAFAGSKKKIKAIQAADRKQAKEAALVYNSKIEAIESDNDAPIAHIDS
jgi:hypothetical protein